jgi:hypothetical protein
MGRQNNRLPSNSHSAGSVDRRFGGRAKLAILDQDWKAALLVEHGLKMFNYRWAALGAGANF